MRSLLTLAFWIVAVPLDALWGFPWTLITGRIDALYRSAMWIAQVGLRIAGIRWKVVGTGNIDPSRKYLFMANHVSNLDPPLLVPILPHRVTVMAKKGLFKIPIFGQAMRMADFVPIDRHNRESAIASVQEAERTIRRGLHMVVFPEGTRSRDGRLLPFKKGPFYLALETGVPIVPVTILDTEKLLPKGKSLARPGTATIIFHAPIDPAQYPDRDQLMEKVREKIASALPPERRA